MVRAPGGAWLVPDRPETSVRRGRHHRERQLAGLEVRARQGHRQRRPGRRPGRNRLHALGRERVRVLRVALDRAHGGQRAIGVGVDLLAGVHVQCLLAAHAHRAVEDLDQVRVVGAHEQLELGAAHLGAHGVSSHLEVGAAREVLHVDQRPAHLLDHVRRLQLAVLLELHARDVHRRLWRHADVGAVGKLDRGVALRLGGDLVVGVERLPRVAGGVVHGHRLVEDDQRRGRGDRRRSLDDEEPVAAAQEDGKEKEKKRST